MSIEVIHIIEQLCREKGIDKNILIDAVKTAVEAAARKKLPHLENLLSQFNRAAVAANGVVDLRVPRFTVPPPLDRCHVLSLSALARSCATKIGSQPLP